MEWCSFNNEYIITDILDVFLKENVLGHINWQGKSHKYKKAHLESYK